MFFFTLIALVMIGLGVAAAFFGYVSPILGVAITAAGLLLQALLFFFALVSLMRHGVARTSWFAFFFGLAAIALLGGAGYLHWHHPIKDVTTDVRNPPKFLHPLYPFGVKYGAELLDPALQLPREYNPLDAAPQLLAYPGFEGLPVKAPAKEAFAEVMRQIRAQLPGWKIVLEDQEKLHSELEVTWPPFQITDDVALEVRPDPASAFDSRVELRSRSRFGLSDFGMNILRLRDLKVRLLLVLKPLEDKFQVQRSEAEKKAQAEKVAPVAPAPTTPEKKE